ncbi:MAG TPA: hypothetical protein VF807_13295 [Ktedonobacterales bacterium]
MTRPVIVGGALYLGAGGSVIRLDVTTGRLLAAYQVIPEPQVTVADQHAGHTFDLTYQWQEPIVADGIIYAGATFHGISSYVVGLDAMTGRILWKRGPARETVSAPVLVS